MALDINEKFISIKIKMSECHVYIIMYSIQIISLITSRLSENSFFEEKKLNLRKL